MQTRRECFGLIGAGILGAGLTSTAPGQVIQLRIEESLLQILHRRSPFIFVAEFTEGMEDEAPPAPGASTVAHMRKVKVLEAIRGEKPSEEVHVAFYRDVKQPKFEFAKGEKRVLFLTPLRAPGKLGEPFSPYNTVDHWFGVMPYSEALIEELKKFPPVDDPLLRDGAPFRPSDLPTGWPNP